MNTIPERAPLPVHRLDELIDRTAQAAASAAAGRASTPVARTAGMRILLVSLGAGGELAEHTAPGPISVQALRGDLRFSTGGHATELAPGDLITLDAQIPHAVQSRAGGSFLLTICAA
ncbi:MAG TPA: cupin domain-containing protein [Longimicrobium sp.]|uniref:cupin domain-containing protein n=1 Tax=Longimicrobium sp. TaxID=2029185 RepID=UPI002EDA2E29